MMGIFKKIESNDALFGLCCVLLATLGLSLKAILIKLVYQADPNIDAISVLVIRYLLALPLFLLVLLYAQKQTNAIRINVNSLVPTALLGAGGFYLAAILDFSALAYISASLERLILFLYPTFVVIISLFLRPSEITRHTVMALIISYVGIMVVFVEQAPLLTEKVVTGSILVFSAALVFAIYTVLSVKQIRLHGSIVFTVYAVIAATITTLIHAFMSHGLHFLNQSFDVYLLILIMALFSTVMPLICMAEGVKRIGASSASIISTSGPPLTLAFAFFILGETFGILHALGGVLILAGVFLVSKK